MTPPLSRDLRSPCGLPAARLSGKPKQKDSENGKALKNRGLRGSKRIYRNFVARCSLCLGLFGPGVDSQSPRTRSVPLRCYDSSTSFNPTFFLPSFNPTFLRACFDAAPSFLRSGISRLTAATRVVGRRLVPVIPFPSYKSCSPIGPEQPRARRARRSEPWTARTDLESCQQRERDSLLVAVC